MIWNLISKAYVQVADYQKNKACNFCERKYENNKGNQRKSEAGILQTSIDGVAGILHMPGLRHCTVIAGWGGGWEHVSVCPENRLPDWTEMCAIKDMFWNDDEVVMQLHPAKSNYVNLMPNCLHLWKPIGREILAPPTLYV